MSNANGTSADPKIKDLITSIDDDKIGELRFCRCRSNFFFLSAILTFFRDDFSCIWALFVYVMNGNTFSKNRRCLHSRDNSQLFGNVSGRQNLTYFQDSSQNSN